jgi:hypothetical protein
MEAILIAGSEHRSVTIESTVERPEAVPAVRSESVVEQVQL